MIDDVLRKLRDLQRKAERLDGEHSVTLSELFPDEFMLRNTEFSTIDELFASSGFKIESEEDFESIPEDRLEIYISEHTRFKSWNEMKTAAANEWAKNQLGLE